MADLDLLRTFVAVARAGSMTAAARQLGLTQAAVSKRIQALEAAFQRPLFQRAGRHLAMTEAGRSLTAEIGPMVDDLQQIFDAAVRGSESRGGPLLLGGPADCLSELVLPALAPLIARGLRPTCQFGVPGELLPALSAGELDLAISSVPRREPGIELLPWLEESFVLVGAPRWQRHIGPGRPGAAQLADCPIAAFDSDWRIVRRYWRDVFGQSPRRKLALVVPDLRALRQAVRAGAAISVLPDYLIRHDLECGDLIDLLPDHRPVPNMLYIARRRRGPRVDRASQVAEWLLERFATSNRRS
ncbi:MAG: LysR family transcriptional regulator [Proteobacteria bacterium]|nr:LysR family transcriptional regulator [Pseudomonadota bacterium]